MAYFQRIIWYHDRVTYSNIGVVALSANAQGRTIIMKFHRLEDEFVINVIRGINDARHLAVARQLAQSDLDWDYIFSLLEVHRLRPLFFKGISLPDAPAVSSYVTDVLRYLTMTNFVTNGRLLKETAKLLDTFSEQGIRALVLKGIPLTYQLYNGLTLREIADIDLLLTPADAVKAKDYLLTQGFYLYYDDVDESQPGFFEREYHFALVRDKPSLRVELHWSLARSEFSRLRDPALLWAKATTLCIDTLEFAVPNAQHTLIFLCMHGFKHNWRRLAWIYDLVRFLEIFPETDWAALLEQADHLYGKRIVLQAFYLAQEIFAAPLPPVITRELEAQPQIQQLSQQLISEVVRYPLAESAVDDFILQYSLRQGWRDRLRYLNTKAQPNENELGERANERHIRFLLYVPRALRLLTRYILPWLFARPQTQKDRHAEPQP